MKHAGPGAVHSFVHTIGHSTRSIGDFVGLLQQRAVELIVDVRTVPRSRFNPQFNVNALPATLTETGIDYDHLPCLGGLRHTTPGSENIGWRNTSFRGYADYMQTDDFQAALDRLVALATERSSAMMCAEAVPWRCHRSLIADALTARGHHVEHIIGTGTTRPHTLTSFAHVENGRITYPAVATQAREPSAERRRQS